MLAVSLLFVTFLLGALGGFLLLLPKQSRWAHKWLVKYWRWRCNRVLSRGKHRHKLEEDTGDAERIQEKILLGMLEELQETDYGQRHRFRDLTDVSSFRKLQPLTGYQHYKDYIEQISEGAENILVPGKTLALVATAGTRGSPRTVPVTECSATERFQQGTMVCLEVIHSHFPGALEKVARFSVPPSICHWKSGISIGPYPSIASYKFLEHLYTPKLPSDPTMSSYDMLYIQLLFALKDTGLTALQADFSWLLHRVFSILETEWKTLVKDIMQGFISPERKLPQDIRKQLETLLLPDPRRARELHTHCENGFLAIAKRIWPRLQVAITVCSGSSELEGRFLQDGPCQGVTLYSPLYCAAEGLVGVNISPMAVAPRYVLCPRSAFFEFIPVRVGMEESEETKCLQDICVEEAYELVITTKDGLFRYRLGDVVQVTGFHNKSPILEFLYRKSQTLSVRGEQITEDEFYRILLRTVRLWPGVALINYCCAESGILGQYSGGSDPHYEVFIAVKGVRDLSEEQRYKLDQVLQEHFPLYKSFRFKGSIGPVRVYLTSPKSFANLLELCSSLSGAPLHAIQPPRTLRYRELAESIRKQVIS
ncbi:GH3 domain-containing protein [Xenopus laevis]|uniref:GH3 domain-containing protein n=2 Tax=Xenopus laevis TaxID=8355 RepID=A0A1L8ERN1_XENLA|nr:GH3 domain-containing protein [Xenopus laevis]XP_018090167.1 GH3 domain-containing protein [Xenopus laevis]OCT61992.1 hypothetical protein XELAEV_18043076mg [Xenopus laevis]